MRALLLALAVCVAVQARADVVTFQVIATTAEEVAAGGTGPANGVVIGGITLDNGTGVGATGTAQIGLNLMDVPPQGPGGFDFGDHHIHFGLPTQTGAIVLEFGDGDIGRIGTTISRFITGLSAETISDIIANPSLPSSYYYHLHYDGSGAAYRSQLVAIPEASSLAFGGIGLAGFLANRWRARRAVPKMTACLP